MDNRLRTIFRQTPNAEEEKEEAGFREEEYKIKCEGELEYEAENQRCLFMLRHFSQHVHLRGNQLDSSLWKESE